jgi:trimethyllysine dioxygenase
LEFLLILRFNLLDRAPLATLPQTEVEQYYHHLKSLTSIIRQKENEFVCRLSPGTVMIFDNFRLLHGRNAYQGTRIVTGCYISRSDYVSRAKTFGIELSA